jgi:uncharacterized membrane protein YgcG
MTRAVMRNGLLGVAVCVALLAAVPAASAASKPLVGIGDQKAQMFDDPRLPWLGVRHARLVVPWFVETKSASAEEKKHVAAWLNGARRSGIQPLVAFGHGFIGWTRIYLPKPAEYRQALRAFRKRWPWVKTIIAWNEANHCSQPTCRKPERAAQYYDIAKEVCPTCTVVATAVIDQPNMVPWLKRFQKAAKHRVSIVGLHNYLDVNRLRSSGTRKLLKAFKGQVWITESGGVVYRRKFKAKVADFPENATHAGKVTRFVLDLSKKLSSRVKRVYLYHWNADRPEPTWDSGLIDWAGIARPGFAALARHLGRNPALAPLPRVLPAVSGDAAPPPGVNPDPPPSGGGSSGGSPPPPSGGGGGGGSGGGGSEPPPPEDPGCSLQVICPILAR